MADMHNHTEQETDDDRIRREAATALREEIGKALAEVNMHRPVELYVYRGGPTADYLADLLEIEGTLRTAAHMLRKEIGIVCATLENG